MHKFKHMRYHSFLKMFLLNNECVLKIPSASLEFWFYSVLWHLMWKSSCLLASSQKSRMPRRHAARIRWRHSSIIQQCKKLCKYETPRLQKQPRSCMWHAHGLQGDKKHISVDQNVLLKSIFMSCYEHTESLDMLLCMSQARSEWCVVKQRDMFSFSHTTISELALDHRPLGWDCTCDLSRWIWLQFHLRTPNCKQIWK